MEFNLGGSSLKKSFLVCFMMCFFGIIIPSSSIAAETTTQQTQIELVLCRALAQLQGGVGRAIAALIIISLAIALFLGKVTWGVAIAVAAGIGLMFGAKGIVDLLAGEGTTMCAGMTGIS